MRKQEFKVGDIVTVDRYNHIDDAVKTEILDIVPFGFDYTALDGYKFNINGCKITTRASSIMESKYYDPVPNEDRHSKLFQRVN